jgi:signal transduction histidine kinase
MHKEFPLDHASLETLAPRQLQNYRDVRYAGDQMGFSIQYFAETDQQRIIKLYRVLGELMRILQHRRDNPSEDTSALLEFIQRTNWLMFIADIRQLGMETYEQHYSTVLSQVVHDIKGGALAALSLYLQLIEMGEDNPDDVARMLFLTRDHLKIMRNAVQGIDPEREAWDHAHHDHGINLIVEKWDHAIHRAQDVSAEVLLDCRFEGVISERCLEFSALDRVLYNLINNATRHTADERVYLSLFPLSNGSDEPHDLRFVVYNSLREEQRHTLQDRYDDNLGELFRGGFTTGGSGVGLRICADFVNNAYGLREFDAGLQGHYFGARCIDDFFVNWVHWPIAAE